MGTTSIDRGPSRCYHLDVQRKEGSIGCSTLEEAVADGTEPTPRRRGDALITDSRRQRYGRPSLVTQEKG